MMEWMQWAEPMGAVLIAGLLAISCLLAWLTNLIALPGNWICVALVALYVWAGPQQGRIAIDYTVLLATFLIALVGEIVEFIASAFGAKRAGASRRSTLYSILGSMVGAIAGAMIGIPVPVIGSLIAALLFGGLGAAAGAMYGEWTDGRRWRENWTIGHATFWGRTFGTIGKFLAGMALVFVVLVALCI
ncbi:DUF456 domain-containing protein [Stieleria tagensis]|uniref:DUF456 domain-containing protein n=1 Tax=Stieleria tagensis TaxID=2956795 RepID=UPI00209B016E|nr:DUF456 domain-containing protein [Stieleria tagensis]